MEIRTKLMGPLRAKSPDGNKLEIADGSTIEDALRALDIADNQVQSIMLNGRMEIDRSRSLMADDELMILAPVGGG